EEAAELLEANVLSSGYLKSSDRSCSLHLVASFPKELELDEKFITHKVSFSENNKAFDYMLKGQSRSGASCAWKTKVLLR
ncbi:hypothetical protein TorRG33x02_044600, partial [Trema orientale]